MSQIIHKINTLPPIIKLGQDNIVTLNPVRFLMLFVLAFAALEILYLAIPDELLRQTVYPYGLIKPSVWLLHLFSHIAVHESQNYIFLGSSSLEIVRGCDSTHFILLSVAALLAFPAQHREKLIGIVVTIFLLWLLNVIRISCLVISKSISEEWFDFVHQLLMPSLFCLGALMIFMAWLGWIKKLDAV